MNIRNYSNNRILKIFFVFFTVALMAYSNKSDIYFSAFFGISLSVFFLFLIVSSTPVNFRVELNPKLFLLTLAVASLIILTQDISSIKYIPILIFYFLILNFSSKVNLSIPIFYFKISMTFYCAFLVLTHEKLIHVNQDIILFLNAIYWISWISANQIAKLNIVCQLIILLIFSYFFGSKTLIVINIIFFFIIGFNSRLNIVAISCIATGIFGILFFDTLSSQVQALLGPRIIIWSIFINHILGSRNNLLFGDNNTSNVSCNEVICANEEFARVVEFGLPHNVLIATVFEHGLLIALLLFVVFSYLIARVVNIKFSFLLLGMFVYMLMNGRSILALDVSNISFLLLLGSLIQLQRRQKISDSINSKFR